MISNNYAFLPGEYGLQTYRPSLAQVSLFYDQLNGLVDGYAASNEQPKISEFGFMSVAKAVTCLYACCHCQCVVAPRMVDASQWPH